MIVRDTSVIQCIAKVNVATKTWHVVVTQILFQFRLAVAANRHEASGICME